MTRISRIAFLCSMMGGAAVLASACGDARAPETLGKTRQALSTTVVISQFYAFGGSTASGGAAFKNDYVELFNMSGSSVDLSTWSLQYGSTANNFSLQFNFPSGTSIEAGKYLLIKLPGGTTGADLPTPSIDASAGTGTINLAQAGGKIALVNSTTLLTCGAAATPCDSGDAGTGIVDFVGYGTASDKEGAATAPASTVANGVFRNLNGCSDTDQNAVDFAAAPAAPRTSTSPAVVCGADAGLDAAIDGADAATDGVVLPDVVVMPDTILPDAASEVAVDAVSGDTGAADAVVDAVADAPKEAAADAGADTATADTGTATTDTGTAPEDTGTADEDTGTLPSGDTGSSSTDTGTTDTGLDIAPAEVSEDSGCGCSTPRSTENSAALAGIALGLAVLARRRRQD